MTIFALLSCGQKFADVFVQEFGVGGIAGCAGGMAPE
jgi:hypothetical protein